MVCVFHNNMINYFVAERVCMCVYVYVFVTVSVFCFVLVYYYKAYCNDIMNCAYMY